jgi:3-hydroxyisobutyrate dehydrogenase
VSDSRSFTVALQFTLIFRNFIMQTANSQPTIAVLGTGGTMAGAMALNLIRIGYHITAWNRTPDRPIHQEVIAAGAKPATSIQAAVRNAEIILMCVADVPDVEAVIFRPEGVINHAKPGSLIIDMTTIGPKAAQQIGQALQSQNIRYLDAPVSGGDIGARNGTLTIMVGGEKDDFTEAKPILEVLGKAIHYCGSIGSGQAIKLSNQVLCAINMVGLCEAIRLAQHQEVDLNQMIEVCSGGAGGSWALSNLGPKIASQDYDPGFMVRHILKDLRLVQETLSTIGADELPGVRLANTLFKAVTEIDETAANQGTQAMIRAYIQC